jgi:hypothetical protein
MGVDICLEWKYMRKTKEYNDDTGFYIRKSYGSDDGEMDILQAAFPNWDYHGAFNFTKTKYLEVCRMGWDYLKKKRTDKDDIEFARYWFNQVEKFYRMGMKKQAEGKQCRVIVSY